jgi:hypothetical protein
MRDLVESPITREVFLAELDQLSASLRDLHVIIDADNRKVITRRVNAVPPESTALRYEAK